MSNSTRMRDSMPWKLENAYLRQVVETKKEADIYKN